jgi:tetratricopeptide (TPR) repeat protein
MCFWGVALALGPNINAPMGPDAAAEAWEAVESARARAAAASPVERALIEALAVRYAPEAQADAREELDRAYAEAMRAAHRAHPDDDDVATLFAEALMDLNPWNHWSPDGQPAAETPEIVATLEGVLARSPGHPGANHLYIHAIEASPTPERAEAAADRLAGLMPGSGHLVHMPSHIYLRIGRYEDAVSLNERAARVDEALFAWCRSQGIYRAGYYPHNIHFIWTAALFEGRSELALTSARRLVAAVPDEMVRAFDFVEEFRAVPYVTLARFGRWDALLGEPTPPEDFRYVTGIHHYARGLAHVRRGEMARAAGEARALEAVAAEAPLAELVFPGGTAADLLRLASLHLKGERAAAAGDVPAAVAALEEAVASRTACPTPSPALLHARASGPGRRAPRSGPCRGGGGRLPGGPGAVPEKRLVALRALEEPRCPGRRRAGGGHRPGLPSRLGARRRGAPGLPVLGRRARSEGGHRASPAAGLRSG